MFVGIAAKPSVWILKKVATLTFRTQTLKTTSCIEFLERQWEHAGVLCVSDDEVDLQSPSLRSTRADSLRLSSQMYV